MKRVLTVLLLLWAVAPARAQAAPRRLSFAEAATLAVQQNVGLRAAALDVAVAEAQLAQARAALSPQLSLTGSYAYLQQPGQTLTFPNPFAPAPPTVTVHLPPPEPNVVLLRLSAQYPLYTGGRLDAQVALAEANLRGARAVLERTKQQVVFQVQQAYLQLLLARENEAAARRAVASAEESVRVARARLAAGVAAPFDVLQAEVSLASAQQGLARAQAQVANAQAALAALVNLPLDVAIEPTDRLEARAVDGTLQEFVQRALRQRPELEELRARAQAARAGIELARSGGRPNVALAAQYDWSGPTSNVASSWSVTLAVTLSLYDGGITEQRVREAELRLQQLALLEAQTRQRVELEVRQAWLSLQQAGPELAAAERGVEQAREALRIARVRFEAGVGTSLELVSAQAQVAQAEVALAAARFNQNLARLQLLLATGSL
ncbi:MAG: TolC family protein [Armatimonadota bacterium]|nr:TolC family protein [Armatimonadota bacterium]